MRHQNGNVNKNIWSGTARIIFIAVVMLWAVDAARAQDVGQETFPTAQAGADALIPALQNQDETALSKILGPDGKGMLSCGSEAQDRADSEQLAKKYQKRHRLVTEPRGKTILYIGAENWPFPVPLVEKNGAWHFDSEAGKEEIRDRTIGEDELNAIQVLHELDDAENEYYKQAHDTEPDDEYAQRIVSDPGTQDGLYWQAAASQPQSPVGPDIAVAADDSKQANSGKADSGNADSLGAQQTQQPFEGYYFRILRSQGPDAPDGAHSYIDNGKMTRGFAILAYPAKYGVTGVMTFVLGEDGEDGTVYQKDLGPNTDEAARAITEYEPDSSWHKAE